MLLIANGLPPAPAHATQLSWVRQFGAGEGTFAGRLILDGAGLYVLGSTYSTRSDDRTEADVDLFIRRYDTAGTELWTVEVGEPGWDLPAGMVADPTGLYIALMLDAEGSVGTEERFWLRKFDLTGTEVWARRLPGQPLSLSAIDDGVYVTGNISGRPRNVVIDTGYLRRYDGDGNTRWTRQFWTGRQGGGTHVTADETGAYIATGGFAVRHYDPDGQRLWSTPSRRLPAQFIEVASDGLYVGGNYLPDFVIRKYTLSGEAVWTLRDGTDGYNAVAAMHADDAGPYVVGITREPFPGQTYVGGRADVFVRTYSPDGHPSATIQFGTTERDFAGDAAFGDAGLFVVGGTHGTLPGSEVRGGAFVALIEQAVR